jgi:heme/copper-type cytochrome/quinol oxidase subunit 1
MTFLVHHWLSAEGMPRRIANYPDLPANVTTLNVISSVGSWILALSILVFLWNVYVTWRHGVKVTEEDPVGLLQFARMGDVLPAAPPQLLPDPANQVRTARLRGALPAHQGGACVARSRPEDPGHLERAE